MKIRNTRPVEHRRRHNEQRRENILFIAMAIVTSPKIINASDEISGPATTTEQAPASLIYQVRGSKVHVTKNRIGRTGIIGATEFQQILKSYEQ